MVYRLLDDASGMLGLVTDACKTYCGNVPQIMIFNLRDRNSETPACAVNQASNDLPLVLKGLGSLDSKEYTGGGNDHDRF